MYGSVFGSAILELSPFILKWDSVTLAARSFSSARIDRLIVCLWLGCDLMIVAETARLTLRHLDDADAPFLCRIFNEPSWLANIGDRGVRTADDATRYIENELRTKYATQGFGMYLVATRAPVQSVGVCGLFKRDALPAPDLGFALLPEYWGQGYAQEAATAVMNVARTQLGLPRLFAITSVNNDRSGHLLLGLGFKFENLVRLAPADEELKLYATI